MNFFFHDVVGIVGTLMVVLSYLFLQLDLITNKHPAYSLLNAVGAALILYSLTFNFNLAAAVIEVFWVLISMIGIWKHVCARKSPQPTGN